MYCHENGVIGMKEVDAENFYNCNRTPLNVLFYYTWPSLYRLYGNNVFFLRNLSFQVD